MKVTPPALRNASAAHQKPADVLLLRILQLGKYYFNSPQMEIRRAGQGPEARKKQRGWMDHSWTGSKVTHQVTATCNIVGFYPCTISQQQVEGREEEGQTFI